MSVANIRVNDGTVSPTANDEAAARANRVGSAAGWGFRHRGLIAALLLTPTAVLSTFSTPAIMEGSLTDQLIDMAAWVLFLIGATLRFWATAYIGGRKSSTVVNEGPYSICRNPLYLGSLLIAIATGLFLKSLLFAAALFVVGVAYVLVTVPHEERALAAGHAEEWDRYCARVPRFWPRFRGWHSPQRIHVDVHAMRLEAARASRWVWAPLLGQLMGQLRLQPWWPHLLSKLW